MQPDRPQLCRFWLAGLVSALANAAPADMHLALDPLVAFTWRYTFAAVPKPLREDFIHAVFGARTALWRELEKAGALRGLPPHAPRALELAHTAWQLVVAFIKVLETDDVLQTWRRCEASPAIEVVLEPLDPERPAPPLSPDTRCAHAHDCSVMALVRCHWFLPAAAATSRLQAGNV